MDETMNTGVEVTTEVSGEEVKPEIMIEETSGSPSKTFMWLVGSGITAVAIGATVAWMRRHKKKKAEKAQEAAEEDLEDEDFFNEDPEVATETTTEVVEETTEKKTRKK